MRHSGHIQGDSGGDSCGESSGYSGGDGSLMQTECSLNVS